MTKEKSSSASAKIFIFSATALVATAAVIFFSRSTSPTKPADEVTTADQNIQNDMILAADIKNGIILSTGCGPCHSFTKENVGKVGPNLLGIFGRKIASKSDYEYSDALKKHQDKTWNAHELNEWLIDPGEYAPGTKMSFAGMLDPQDRADLIAYLMTIK